MSLFSKLNLVNDKIDKYNIYSGLMIFNHTIDDNMYLKYIVVFNNNSDTYNQNLNNQTNTTVDSVCNDPNNTSTNIKNDIIIDSLKKLTEYNNKKSNYYINNYAKILKMLMTMCQVYKINISSDSINLYQEIKTNENTDGFDDVLNINIKNVINLVNKMDIITNNNKFYLTYSENNSKYCTYNVYEDYLSNLKLCLSN